MRAIWKFPLPLGGIETVNMPKGAKVLSAHAQGREAMIWALIDGHTTETEERVFAIVPTGNALPMDDAHVDKLVFIGTCLFMDGRFIYHVFEVPK